MHELTEKYLEAVMIVSGKNQKKPCKRRVNIELDQIKGFPSKIME